MVNDKISVVILNFKTKDLTLKCIRSVRRSNYHNLEIFVIDNNSGDGIGEDFKKTSKVNFIQNKDNLGYSGGNNIGIKQALKKGAKYILILNPDTEIDKDCISNLVKALIAKKSGIAGPKIYFKDKRTIWYAGGVFDKLNGIGSHRGVNEKDNGQYEDIEETDFVTGAAMLVDAKVFERIGLFDERFFLYYEDSDLCFRAKEGGYKIIFVPNAVVVHSNAQSTGLGSKLQDYYISRNRMLFASKFLGFRIQFALLRESLRNFSNPERRQALLDFILGRFGKRY